MKLILSTLLVSLSFATLAHAKDTSKGKPVDKVILEKVIGKDTCTLSQSDVDATEAAVLYTQIDIAKGDRITSALHFRATDPAVNINAYDSKGKKVFLYEDAGSLDRRVGRASQALIHTIAEHCKD